MKNSIKNTWELFKLDWQRIFKNPLTFLLIIALMIIPSLYAWFNIAALWDPYANTKDISIAVYSDDKTVDVMDKEINIGDKIIKNLKKNKTVGWRFVDSKKELDKGVQSGKYYGGIYLPQNFSANLTSFVNGDIKKPEIKYSVNQKINAIAPKITDKGAGAIKDTISTQFVETVSDTLLKTFNEVGYDLDSNLASINKVSGKVLELDDNLDKIDDYTKELIEVNKNMPEYKDKLAKANEFIDYMPELNKMGDKIVDLNKRVPELKESGKVVLDLKNKIPEIENAGKQIAMVDEDFDQVVEIMDSAITEANRGLDVIQQAQEVLPEVENMAKTANEVVPEISASASKINDALPEVASGIGSGLTIVTLVSHDISEANRNLANILSDDQAIDEKKASIAKVLNTMSMSTHRMTEVIESTVSTMDALEQWSGRNNLSPMINRLSDIQSTLMLLENRNNDVTNNIDRLSTDELANRLADISDLAADISTGVDSIDPSSMQKEISSIIDGVQDTLGSAEKITNKIVDEDMVGQLDTLLDNTSKTITQAIEMLEKYQKELPDVKNEIHSANEILNGNMSTIVGGINKAADVYEHDLPELEKKLDKAADFVKSDLPKLENDLTKTLKVANDKFPEVEEALTTATKMIENDWPNMRKGIHKAADFIRKGKKEIDLKEVIKVLKADAKAESDFIANPVKIDQKNVYPVPNNGSASSPFYTALCLWVGAVLFSSIATTDFHLSERAKKKYSMRQQFLARMATFLVVAFFQALIVSLGNLWLLGIYAVNPVYTVTFALLVGLVFMTMVYVLVSLAGNLGKGAAVIILVLSISGGGGNYPIEMSGKFFQFINPLLPFTHAVNLLREPVGGIYWPNTSKALIILILIGIGFFAIGFFLFPKVKGFFKGLNDKLKEGHILH
ncbi:YhgE/Pip domain-containing protein [Vagococcus intermedius]|uniref:YhgE/Pip domain-containing protein n=1 Tax=Vagococcus intermedius TaxID=2991418 RepID=A0AAF0CU56_9ENTE|nr:YhgE/Pip domain-containing protein [Vagococcus intermedius]WEG72889.1 YhgE/Pip domain-containing protein [Vagococcus intermedius]WEG74976.1 YhgE/Pip domain-containing protein [Vagococcus intermedius]